MESKHSADTKVSGGGWTLFVLLALTALVVVIVGLVAMHASSPSASGTCVGTLKCLTANEWGDFLAGFFAPLAFIWLVGTVWIQSSELRAQRQELALTRKEFELSRDVLIEQAVEVRKQAQYIEVQTRLLSEEANARKRGEYLTSFVALIDRYVERSKELQDQVFFRVTMSSGSVIQLYPNLSTPEHYIQIQSEWIGAVIELGAYDIEFEIIKPEGLEELYSYIFAAEELLAKIPFHARVSWRRSKLSALVAQYGEFFRRSAHADMIKVYLQDRSTRIVPEL